MLKNVYLAGGVRTPHGSFNGSLAQVPAAQLGATVIKGALAAAKVAPDDVDEVYMGNVLGAGLGQNIARQCAFGAGLKAEIGATTINKVCGSAMRAIIIGAQAIQCDDLGMVVAGGAESMSGAPYLLSKARSGYRMGNGELIDAMIHDGLWDVYNNKHMGCCGDTCCEKYNITREEQDAYAIESYKRAIAAWDNGYLKDVVVPVEIKTRKGTVVVDKDEDLAKFNAEKLVKLRPAFGPDSRITAGNASNINDGASAIVVMGEERMKALGIKPSARILGHTNAATDPEWFTVAPIYAMKKLTEKLSLKLADVDLFEINEAFSVVPMVAMRELGIPHEKVNVCGGAVAIGHPIGTTGARIVIELIHSLHRTGGKLGIACLCIGGGEASAIAVETCA
ncbi:MAG: thiolase family protein [Phycisphaerae bacterium]|nr:thiolase family protein [Phycisphaerae bacterium]